MHTTNSGTTLVTFLVRTPPHVRSLKLLGSWDNFSREYDMEKDTRLGKGYWRGCHTFTNIICDGQLQNAPRGGRDGALKMGGTYWYHYRIDDDTDFYNEAEPSTTSCPFLPGQPVNLLSVPVHLPSVDKGHRRDSSAASQTSIKQTMNPEDKYMNPRPPPRPKLRLMTSQGLQPHQGAWTSPLLSSPKRPFHGRSSSHPREAQPRRRFRTGGKQSIDLRSRGSSSAKSNPIRAAFLNFASPRFGGRNYDHGGNAPRSYGGGKLGIHAVGSRSEGHNRYLGVDYAPPAPAWRSNCSSPLRSPLDTSSREELRHRNSRQRDTSSPRSHQRHVAPKHDPLAYSKTTGPVNGSGQDADASVVPCKPDVGNSGTTVPVDLNSKRLPTLPNSPSSVLDEEFAATNTHLPDLEALRSHFSESSTVSPGSSPNDTPHPGGSHFSECTFESGRVSPSSMTSTSTYGNYGEYGQPHTSATDKAVPAAQCPDIKILSPESTKRARTAHPDSNTSPDPRSENTGSRNHSPLTYDYDLTVSGLFITKPPKTTAGLKPPQPRARHDGSPAPSLSSFSLSPSYHDIPSPYSPGESSTYHSQESSALTTPRVGDEAGTSAEWNKKKGENVQPTMQDLIDEMSYMANMIRDSGLENY